ncbi:Shedu immune nuclease family protein [Pseudonocardia oceani]|nr:Shedu immune nuclease family protein [Pseudonocardia oceani]
MVTIAVSADGTDREEMPRGSWVYTPPPPPTEVGYALGRLPERTYISRSFRLDLRNSQDYGEPARFVTKVFDEAPEPEDLGTAEEIEWTEAVVSTTPGGRKQIKIQIARQAGQVREIEIQKVPTNGDAERMDSLLKLDRKSSARLIQVIQSLQYVPVEGDEGKVRLDDDIMREFFTDPENVISAYRRSPGEFRRAIVDDPNADDVVAIAHRREVVAEFRSLMEDEDYFESERGGGKPEAVWQRFLEANPWILGIGLTGQLLTSWDRDKLEKVVAGFSVGRAGKRVDGLLRTTGSIRSLVFAEIKHHKTGLLAGGSGDFRSGCWPPSAQCSGGVAQIQQTIALASQQIGEALPELDDDGAETGESSYFIRPRSFLILGHLDQLRGSGGGVHRAKHRSFELYRRNLYEPEIITFDELLARAEWSVDLAEQEQDG